jgi:hypothetical protein
MLKPFLRQLEITFWKIAIPLMSESRHLSRVVKSFKPSLQNDEFRDIVKKGIIWAGAGWSLGLTIAIFSAFLL